MQAKVHLTQTGSAELMGSVQMPASKRGRQVLCVCTRASSAAGRVANDKSKACRRARLARSRNEERRVSLSGMGREQVQNAIVLRMLAINRAYQRRLLQRGMRGAGICRLKWVWWDSDWRTIGKLA